MTETIDSISRRLDRCEDRIEILEQRSDTVSVRVDEIMRSIAAMRAEWTARQEATVKSLSELSGDMSRLSGDVVALTCAISEQAGAQRAATEYQERKTQRWQRIAVVISILTGVGGMALSWQEVASYVWVNILHLKEPWS